VSDIDSFWEYSDPAASEERFRRALEASHGDQRLELLTQIARTYSLRRRFEDATALLDDVESHLAAAGPRPRLRYLLERGRTFNSSGDRERARFLFQEAWELARSTGQEGLAVDAAHMMAIACGGSPEAGTWNDRGLELARTSLDAKALSLIPAILNNSAWDLHDAGRFHEALPRFEEALAEWTARGREEQIRVARWSVARCLRSLDRYEEALAIQRELEAAQAAEGTVDTYVIEEIDENLKALGRR
jgi:tetratricopeptide (TPR) repeat protein